MNYLYQLKQELSEGWMGLHLVLGIALLSRFLHGLIQYPLFNKSKIAPTRLNVFIHPCCTNVVVM